MSDGNSSPGVNGGSPETPNSNEGNETGSGPKNLQKHASADHGSTGHPVVERSKYEEKKPELVNLKEINAELMKNLKTKSDELTTLTNKSKEKEKAQTKSISELRKKLNENGKRLDAAANKIKELEADKRNLKDDLKKVNSSLEQLNNQKEQLELQLNESIKLFTESNKRWIQDRDRTAEAEELQKTGKAEIKELRRRKATVEEKNERQMVELKEHLKSMNEEHQGAQELLHDKNRRLNEELEAAKRDTRTITAELTERLEEQDYEVTDQRALLERKQTALNIAKACTQKLTEQCAQNEANKQLFSQQFSLSQRLLEEKNQECQTLRDEVAEMEQLRNEIHIREDRQIVFDDKIKQAKEETTEQRRNVSLLKVDIDKAEKALREAYRQDEIRRNELRTKDEEKQRLIRDILNLRRQLDDMGHDNQRLRVNCDHLRDELHANLNVP